MDKFKLFQRFVAGVLCAGLLVGSVPAEARAAESGDTEVVDSVFSDVMEVEAEPVSETETAIFSAVLPVETSGSSQVRNLTAVQAAEDEVMAVGDFTIAISADYTEKHAGPVELTATPSTEVTGYYWTDDEGVTPGTGDFIAGNTYTAQGNGTFYCWARTSAGEVSSTSYTVSNITNYIITRGQPIKGYANEKMTVSCTVFATAGSTIYRSSSYGVDINMDFSTFNTRNIAYRYPTSFYANEDGIYTVTIEFGARPINEFSSLTHGAAWFQVVDSKNAMVASDVFLFEMHGPKVNSVNAVAKDNGKWLLTVDAMDLMGPGVESYFFSKSSTAPNRTGDGWQTEPTKEVDADEQWFCWVKNKDGRVSKVGAGYSGIKDPSEFTSLPVSSSIYVSETRGLAPRALLAPGARLDYYALTLNNIEIENVSEDEIHSSKYLVMDRALIADDWVVDAHSGGYGITAYKAPGYGITSRLAVWFSITKSTDEIIWSPVYTVTQYAPTVESVNVVCPDHVHFTVTANAKDGKDYGVRDDAVIKYYYFSRSATNPSPSSTIGSTTGVAVGQWTTSPVLETTQDGIWYCWVESSTGYISAAKTFTLVSEDKTPPVMQSVTASSYTNNSIALTAKATDDHADGVHKFYVARSTDGTVPAAPTKESEWMVSTIANSYSWSETITEDTTFYVWAMDSSGNISTEYKSIKVGYDIVAPEIVSVTPVFPAGSSQWTCGPVSFIVKVKDNIGVAAAAVTSSNATYAPGAGWTTTKNDDGSFTAVLPGTGIINDTTVYIWIKDVAGNTACTTYDVKLEKVAPTATIKASRTVWGTEDVKITISDYADTGGSGTHATPYSYDGGATWVADTSKTFSEAKEVVVKVRDNAGNTLSQTVQVKVDKATPKISDFSYTCSTPGQVKLTVTAADQATGATASGIAGYYLQKVTDGSTPAAPGASDSGWIDTTKTTYSWDETISQNVTYYVWAKDYAGNVSEAATKVFTQPTIGLYNGKTGDILETNTSNWLDWFSYDTRNQRTLKGIKLSEGSSEATDWQWQKLAADGVTWEDIKADDTYFPETDSYSPSLQTFRYYFGKGARLTDIYIRVKVSGDWGVVYSPYFLSRPTERVGISAKAILSGTSEEYTNGPVKIQLTLEAPRYPSNATIYGYVVDTSSEVPAESAFNKEDQADTYEVDMGVIGMDTTFYAHAVTAMSGKVTQISMASSMDTVPVKYDAKAPEITGVTADMKAKSITVTAVDEEGTDADGNACGASGVVAYYYSTSSDEPALNDESWIACADGSYTFTGLTAVKTYYFYVKDGAGNISKVESEYLPSYFEYSVSLSLSDSDSASYKRINFDIDSIKLQDSIFEVGNNNISTKVSDGVSLTDPTVVSENYNSWGSASANEKLGIQLGFYGTAKWYYVSLTSAEMNPDLGNLIRNISRLSISLYNAAAYTVQEDREFTITVTNKKGDTRVINLTIPGIDSKTLSIDVDTGSISLQPGTSAESVSDSFSIKNNNPYPISLTMSGVTAAAGSPTVVTSTPDKTKELKSAGVQVGIQTGSTKTYYTGSPISIGNLGYEATQQFNYLMKFSPLYTGDGGEKISYNVNFGVSVSAEDITS